MTAVTREYLPGLKLAQQFIAESVSEEAASDLDVLIAQASAAPEQEPVEIDWPEFSDQGMGCGLEDRGITDRYEAMRYGYDEALDQVAQIIDGMGPLYTHPSNEIDRLRNELTESDKCVVRALNERDAALKKLDEAQAIMGKLLAEEWLPRDCHIHKRINAFLSATAQPDEVKS